MPNRKFREGLLRSRKLALASGDEERMFTRLALVVDDFGRFDADPEIVRAACFPRQLDTITKEMVAAWLDRLEAGLHLIVRYRSGRDVYLVLLNTDPPRANSSKYPPPPKELDGQIKRWSSEGPPVQIEAVPEVASETPAVRAHVNTCEHVQTRVDTCEQVRADAPVFGFEVRDPNTRSGSKKHSPPPPDGGSSFDSDFDGWWEEYPLKEGRKPALLKYRAARRSGASPSDLLDALRYDLDRRSRMRAAGEFVPNIPHAKTWLGQERWRELLERQRDEVGAAEQLVVTAEERREKSRREYLEFMAVVRRKNRRQFDELTRAMGPDDRGAFEQALDEIDQAGGAKAPEEPKAAGGAG